MHLDEHHHVPIIDERLFGYETLLTVIIRRPSTQLMIGSLAICQMHITPIRTGFLTNVTTDVR